MEKAKIQELIRVAIKQMDYAYAPYSHFYVGAALLAKNGTVYTGCNIENAAYGPSNCGERTAFFKAVSEGVRDFSAICVVCRQVMMEFCDPKTFEIILAMDTEHYQVMRLEELLPMGFGPDNLAD